MIVLGLVAGDSRLRLDFQPSQSGPPLQPRLWVERRDGRAWQEMGLDGQESKRKPPSGRVNRRLCQYPPSHIAIAPDRGPSKRKLIFRVPFVSCHGNGRKGTLWIFCDLLPTLAPKAGSERLCGFGHNMGVQWGWFRGSRAAFCTSSSCRLFLFFPVLSGWTGVRNIPTKGTV